MVLLQMAGRITPNLCKWLIWLLQVLELTQGQQIEKEILAVLVQQMQEGRQKEGMDGQDKPSEHHPVVPVLLGCLVSVYSKRPSSSCRLEAVENSMFP